MADSKSLFEIVGDVTECPICTDVIVDSKVLPCIHTFCFKCLKEFWKEKKPGDRVPCPLCRTPFNIPERGLSNLPKNCFIEKLLEAQKSSKTSPTIIACDICSNLKKKESEVAQPASKYCVDCEDNLCEVCASMHSVTKILKEHHVVKLGDLSISDSSMKHALKNCNQHKDEKIKIYCLDCETAVCQTCFIIKHNGHKCADIYEVIQDLKDQIKKDIGKTYEMFLKVSKQSGNFEKVVSDFVLGTKETEAEIVRRGDEIKQLVDKQVQSLLHELAVEKTRKLKEFENAKEELQVQKISLASFMKYSQKVIDTAIPSDIACLAAELRTRADNLMKIRIVPVGKQVKISFFPTDLKMYTDGSNAKSIVGKNHFSNENSILDSNSTSCNPNSTMATDLSSPPVGITMSEKEIFIILEAKPEIQVFDCASLEPLRVIPVPALNNLWDITFSENILFVATYLPELIYKISLHLSESVNGYCWHVDAIQATLSTLKSGNILATCHNSNKLMEYTTTGQLVREIPLQGITNPNHAVQSDNDRFLVSFGGNINRVCSVNNKGQPIKSYGSASGSGPGRLYNPYHLSTDANGFCLVAEFGGANRVILLNDNLQFVKELVPQSILLKRPIRLCLDRTRRKLLVAEYDNRRVVVFDVLL